MLTDQDYLDSRNFLLNEDNNGFGYICSLNKKNGEICAKWWAPNSRRAGVIYHSVEKMFEKAKEFSNSLLIDYSPMHAAKYKMMLDFIDWYETLKSHERKVNKT